MRGSASLPRRFARRVVPRSARRRLRPPPPPWVIAMPSPREPRPLEQFAFYAILGTWMEADIVADTVSNAFAQGVDRVFLVDNASPDDTVRRAVACGAEHMITYRTERFEERHRYNLMNELVRHVSSTSEYEHIWWLWLDADEFPRPQSSGTIREQLQTLDRGFRVVGARVLNHYPTPGEVAHVPGRHPAEVQPLCEEVRQHICDAMHRKHPLQRWDRAGPRIDAGLGFHRAESEERPLHEPMTPIVIHHVPFRDEETTRRRIEALWRGVDEGASRAVEGDLATDHMHARRASLDAVYAGQWDRVQNFIPGMPDRGVQLRDWRSLAPRIDPVSPRWS